jgi:hypothetical protein
MTAIPILPVTESSHGDVALLNVHVAEYEAMTTRCTYFMALQMGLWPLLLLFWPLLAQLRGAVPDRSLVWLGLLASQIVLFVYVHLLAEQYLMLVYIENDLRGMVGALIVSKVFWCYERSLLKQRYRAGTSTYRLLGYAVIAFITLVIVLQRPFTWSDAPYGIANVAVVTVVVHKVRKVSELRRELRHVT